VASKLTEKQKQLLDANLNTRIGLKTYEDGLWGSQGNRDFVYFELLDESNNLIQFENIPSSEFIVNTDNNNIEFYPGNHIRTLGYQSGVFNIRYNFLRKLAGDESPVLLHTLNKNDTKIGDVYTNINAIYVTEDSIVYAATEENYKLNPTTTEQLAIEELAFQIHEISPSRTELRLSAKKINGTYHDDFIDIQSAVKLREVVNQISFIGGEIYDTKDLILTTVAGGFLFTPKMVDGTITIPNIFMVNQIDVPVKTNLNIVDNGGGDALEMDNLGNVVNASTLRGWDTSLHADAVRAINWTDGFHYFNGGTFGGTAHVGYHAHWVEGEGTNGGNCIKFPDQNEMFMDLPEWPNEQRYRWLGISQEMPNLLGQGIKHLDIANINLDIRSTVANKGVQVSLRYTSEMATEEIPTSPPVGYFNPNDPPPGEPVPGVPEGFMANTSGNAQQIENQPPNKHSLILAMYDLTFYDGAVGDDTNDGDMIQGAGAWIITSYTQGTIPGSPGLYQWSPNLFGVEYSKAGTLSTGGEWLWDGTAWGTNPSFTNPYPSPPLDTVNGLEFPDAVNGHPYQLEGQGTPIFARNTRRGENDGWQAATFVNSEDIILIKDDLVWETKNNFTTNHSKVILSTIDQWFPSLHNHIMDNGKTLYQDIFENGRIQSITRTRTSNTSMRTDFYIIFYTDGSDDERSNKAFMVKKGNSVIGGGGIDDGIKYMADLDGSLNDFINDNGGNLATSVRKHTDNNRWYHYFVVPGVDKYWRMSDGDGDFFELAQAGGTEFFDTDYPKVFTTEGFRDMPDNSGLVDGIGANMYNSWWNTYGWISKNSSGVDTFYNLSTGDAHVTATHEMQTVAYGAGEVGTNGVDLIFGSRNPGADNYNQFAVYDDGTSIFSFDANPTKNGTLSPAGLYKWNGSEWVNFVLPPPSYNYKSPMNTRAIIAPEIAGDWVNMNVEIPIPSDWLLDQKWYLFIYGHGKSNDDTMSQGIVWVDNVFIDFTLKDQSETIPVYKPFTAQIQSVNSDGSIISVDKSIREQALEIGANDDDEDGNPDIYNLSNELASFENFKVTYTNFNPKDLRTYLKFENNLFLTTNFKSDKVNVTTFPYSIVYKLYEPLPDSYEKFDECIVVKEMANPLEEKVKIIDFVNEEEPKLVLRSPDLNNVESPVQRRETQFQVESDILTSDNTVSTALRNEFLSQSLDSAEINTDYSRFKNFVNFGSSEVRIRNFKRKLEDIEQYKINSASYAGVSGSSGDMSTYHHKILDTKNKLDRFENYMYFKSSSYISSSIGIFHDNAWPKSDGAGTLNSPYVLAHTTSSQADTWFINAVNSASLYDDENSSKLSSILPEHIKADTNNKTYLKFTDMIGQHFDEIWEYINAITDVTDRRESLSEGVSRDLLYSVAKSLGWSLDDGKDLVSLSKYALGKEVSGSAYSDYSATSERDISREIWSRIINNMPFFLKNKGTVRALKGLINVYGIPSTILRVKEYGGPNLPDDASPQFEITRKFTKALDFKGAQYVRVAWANDTDSGRKPDTVEFRFRAASGSNQILVEKQDSNNQNWFIRLKDNGSTDNYGQVSFMLSGSAVGKNLGQFKEMTSTSLPIYDGDFYSVMVGRISGSSNTAVSQSYQLNVGKYDSSRSKIHLYSTSTMDVTQAASSSFSNAWTGSGNIYIGGSDSLDDVGVQFTGSIMEYRHWTEVLNTGSFKNHIANPKAYDGNTVSSSYSNLVLRYSMDDNKNLNTDTVGIRDVSSNQTSTVSGSHSGFTGNFFRSVVDELKTHIPSIGALRRTTNKIRIEDNKIKSNFNLNSEHRATVSAYDTAPSDSNKVGIWFAPTDVINTDIINSVGNLNFEDYLGDPRDKEKLSYNGLNFVADNYWKKYTAPNNFWDYVRMIKYYDQSLYPQLRKLIPARAKPGIGLLIEPNIFERPKVVVGKKPDAENKYYSSSINIGNVVDGLIIITGSYNTGHSITDYDAYTGRIDMYSYDSGSSVISSSGEYLTFEATGSEVRDRNFKLSIWQRLGTGNYKSSSITQGDVKYSEVLQPIITGSRVYGVNQKLLSRYSSSLSASLEIAYSSSYYNVDLDNYQHLTQGLINSYYVGVKNNANTTSDGQSPVEVIISAPTKLVTTKGGDSTLKTGDGIVSDYKEAASKEEKEILNQQKKNGNKKNNQRNRGLRKLSDKPQTDQDRKKGVKEEQFKKEIEKGGIKQNKNIRNDDEIDEVSKNKLIEDVNEKIIKDLKNKIDKK
tara:strand:+ start:2173 stop:8862 length:6690 start_codon:yes stop_codon:yes gene_type:complete